MPFINHEMATLIDASSRWAEAVAVVVAALYARHGARIAKRTARMLGTLPLSWWRRRRPAGEDPNLDALKAAADATLAAHLTAQKRLNDYTERPRESRHTDDR